eukprot:TRINITY_DN1188_c0_g4_i1.p1 TRINITY_DN1188_c0_g4~~TRINITY_DN1188_c0_g4_i1.p1  ORF type:complete len:210 (-),score=75.86 TRINITY_DN1188_c0_g4_i1:161-790(-)
MIFRKIKEFLKLRNEVLQQNKLLDQLITSSLIKTFVIKNETSKRNQFILQTFQTLKKQKTDLIMINNTASSLFTLLKGEENKITLSSQDSKEIEVYDRLINHYQIKISQEPQPDNIIELFNFIDSNLKHTFTDDEFQQFKKNIQMEIQKVIDLENQNINQNQNQNINQNINQNENQNENQNNLQLMILNNSSNTIINQDIDLDDELLDI